MIQGAVSDHGNGRDSFFEQVQALVEWTVDPRHRAAVPTQMSEEDRATLARMKARIKECRLSLGISDDEYAQIVKVAREGTEN